MIPRFGLCGGGGRGGIKKVPESATIKVGIGGGGCKNLELVLVRGTCKYLCRE
jgi:hypothetical protein